MEKKALKVALIVYMALGEKSIVKGRFAFSCICLLQHSFDSTSNRHSGTYIYLQHFNARCPLSTLNNKVTPCYLCGVWISQPESSPQNTGRESLVGLYVSVPLMCAQHTCPNSLRNLIVSYFINMPRLGVLI